MTSSLSLRLRHKELGDDSPDKIRQAKHDENPSAPKCKTLNIVLHVASYPVVFVYNRILNQELAGGSNQSAEELVGERSHKDANHDVEVDYV